MKILMLHETLTKANSNIKKEFVFFLYFHFNAFIFVINNINKMKNIKDCVCYWPMPHPFFEIIHFVHSKCLQCMCMVYVLCRSKLKLDIESTIKTILIA